MACSVRFHGSVSPRAINTSASVRGLQDGSSSTRILLRRWRKVLPNDCYEAAPLSLTFLRNTEDASSFCRSDKRSVQSNTHSQQQLAPPTSYQPSSSYPYYHAAKTSVNGAGMLTVLSSSPSSPPP